MFCESIGNPAGNVVDIQRLAEIAHKHGVPLIVDNTVATPYLCQPFDFGADIVVHALTKYIGGHGNSIGGMIVDSGKFDWNANKDRFPILNEPDPSYHGVVYTEALGPAAYHRPLPASCRCATPARRCRRTTRSCSSWASRRSACAWSGTARMPRRSPPGCKKHPKINWVNYAALPDSKYNATAKKITKGKASGIVSFGIKGGAAAGGQFIDALQMILRLVNIGDAKSLACHPASTTHRQLGPEELAKAGVSEDLVRISVGIEHIDDIIADVEQALAKVA